MAIQEYFPKWTPKEMASYYGFPMNYTGKGQSIGIISLGGAIDMTELQNDFQALGVPFPDIKVVDATPIPAAQNSRPTGETHLDVEVIGCICPDAAITIYRGVNDSTSSGFVAAIQKAIDDGNSVISISWGSAERGVNDDMEKVLAAAKASKVTVTVAAGDGGSSDARGQNGGAGRAADGEAHVDYPASSPNVLACGGTERVGDGTSISQAVWNNSSRNGGATGGGVSVLFPVPSYQSDAGIHIVSANDGSSTGRVVPDVSGLAAGGDWEIYEGGQGEGIGGTSAVAPLYAALITLINEKRSESSKGPLGFINDELYRLAAKGGLFTDITVGDNRSAEGYPGYEATAGFDAASGWGTPIGAALTDALAGI